MSSLSNTQDSEGQRASYITKREAEAPGGGSGAIGVTQESTPGTEHQILAALLLPLLLPGSSQQPCEVGRAGRFQRSPFKDEDAEAQRGEMTGLTSQSQRCKGPKANIPSAL